MKDSRPVEPIEAEIDQEEIDKEDAAPEEVEATQPMPFGVIGITLLCNILQYAVFLGLTMLVLMIIRIFGPS